MREAMGRYGMLLLYVQCGALGRYGMLLKLLFLKTLYDWTLNTHAFSTKDFLEFLDSVLLLLFFIYLFNFNFIVVFIFIWTFPLYTSHVLGLCTIIFFF